MTPILDTLMVKFKRWDDTELDGIVARHGGKVRSRLPLIRWAVVTIDHTRAADLFQAFLADPDVEDVEFDSVAKADVAYFTSLPPGNTLLDHLWGLKRINAFAAFKHATGLGVKVAIVDSGMNLNHRTTPSFVNKPMEHWNSAWQAVIAETQEENWEDVTVCGARTIPFWQHGMGCIATAVADGLNETTPEGCGTAPKASLVNISAFQDLHQGNAATVTGLYNAVQLFGAKVVSVSWGAGGGSGPVNGSGVYWDCILAIRDQAVLFASAGNDAASSVQPGHGWQYPAAYMAFLGGFGVGCTSYEELDKPAAYSNGGLSANIVAPGHANWIQFNYIWSLSSGTPLSSRVPAGYVSDPPGIMERAGPGLVQNVKAFDGTSCASPMAAGVAALVIQAAPSLTIPQVRQVLLDTTDKGQHPEFYKRFLPTTGVVNALKAVLKAMALESPGTLYPYINFFGRGVTQKITAGTATWHLRGALKVEITGFSTNAVTGVELWADTEKLYDGPPRTTWGDNLLEISAAKLAGKAVKVVVKTASGQSEETYTDIVAYAISPTTPPRTVASPSGGMPAYGEKITLRSFTDNPPVRIQYRWGAGPWQLYTTPINPQTGTLQFYGVDALGNIEGGVDHASQ